MKSVGLQQCHMVVAKAQLSKSRDVHEGHRGNVDDSVSVEEYVAEHGQVDKLEVWQVYDAISTEVQPSQVAKATDVSGWYVCEAVV